MCVEEGWRASGESIRCLSRWRLHPREMAAAFVSVHPVWLYPLQRTHTDGPTVVSTAVRHSAWA